MSEEKPTPLQQHIITHGNAAFDCGAWDVEDEGRVRYQDLLDHATAARLALEQAIEQALTEARQAGENLGLLLDDAIEDLSALTHAFDERDSRKQALRDRVKRYRAIAQALTEARQAGERAGMERAAGIAESMFTPNIAHAIRQAAVRESPDHIVDANKKVDERETNP